MPNFRVRPSAPPSRQKAQGSPNAKKVKLLEALPGVPATPDSVQFGTSEREMLKHGDDGRLEL